MTVPYERYSIAPAQWWIGRRCASCCARPACAKADVDGFCVSRFSLAPDTAVGLTQHFGLSPRWLDHVPMGGASGVVALRRAARAVQAGDASVVAVVAGDANGVTSFQDMLPAFSRFAQDASYPYGAGGPNAQFRADHRQLHARIRRHARGFRRDLRRAARQRARQSQRADEEAADARAIYGGAADQRPVTLFDCVMPCAGAEAFLVMREDDARAAGLPHARLLSTIERHNAFPDDVVQYRGGWALDARSCGRWRASRPRTSTSSRPTTIIP